VYRLATTLVAWLAAVAPLYAQPTPDPGRMPVDQGLPPVEVQALHYGDVLFHVFREDTFGAIVRTEAYKARGLLGPHESDAELMLGGLYLSFGQSDRAAETFRRLLAQESTPPAVRSRSWFYLGKAMHARGHYEESVEALRRAAGALPEAMEAERQLLLAQGLMQLGRYVEAVGVLVAWKGAADGQAFARYNLGIALVRAGSVDQGLSLLETVGTSEAPTEELKALRDKANVAQGYANLQAGRPAAARAALERVRLTGPQSNKALLGAGWADAAEGRFAEALAPWIELRGRSLLDAAVQESYLAVPYAYARLTADRQAATSYEVALAAYEGERRRLQESIEAIRSGRMLAALLESAGDDRDGSFWQLKALPDTAESRYLYHLLAGHEIHETLKHYRSLVQLGRNLDEWAGNLDAYADMVDARRQSLASKLPAATSRLEAVDIEALDARRDVLHARLDGAVRAGDWAILADADERRLLDLVAGVEAGLAARPDEPGMADARDKARLARGVLQWRLEADGKERAWHMSRSLRNLDAQLFDTRTRLRAVTEAMATVPARDAGYSQRIATLQRRVEQLAGRVAAARRRQGEYLAALAIEELEAQQSRLADYTLQARYALAVLYDRGLTKGGATAEGAAP
jgi:tetratricopeptide (TPR) repeat protein